MFIISKMFITSVASWPSRFCNRTVGNFSSVERIYVLYILYLCTEQPLDEMDQRRRVVSTRYIIYSLSNDIEKLQSYLIVLLRIQTYGPYKEILIRRVP